jgi:hypothetical protein
MKSCAFITLLGAVAVGAPKRPNLQSDSEKNE